MIIPNDWLDYEVADVFINPTKYRMIECTIRFARAFVKARHIKGMLNYDETRYNDLKKLYKPIHFKNNEETYNR